MIWLPNFNINMIINNAEYDSKKEINQILEDVRRNLDTLSTKLNAIG